MDQSFQSVVERADENDLHVQEAPFLRRQYLQQQQGSNNIPIIDLLNSALVSLDPPSSEKQNTAHIPRIEKVETFKQQPFQLTKCNDYKQKLNTSLQSTICEVVMSVITIYILYADDLRVLCTDKKGDNFFYLASFICLIIFMTEFIMLTIVRPGYIFSFFFWMDLLSTISTAMDIPQVVNLLMLSFLSAQSSFVKAGRASKISARATKIIRIIRLIRIIRVAKLYYKAQLTLAKRFKVNLSENSQGSSSETSELPIDCVLDNAAQTNTHLQSLFRPRASSLKQQSFSNFDNTECVKDTFTQNNTILSKNVDLRVDKKTKRKLNNRASIMLLIYWYSRVQSKQDQNDSLMKPQNSTMIQTIQQSESNLNYHQDILIVNKLKTDKVRHLELTPLHKQTSKLNFAKIQKFKAHTVVPESLVPVQFLEEAEVQQPEIQEMVQQETLVGLTLSNLTTKRAIFLIFSVIISIPLFEYSTYFNTTDSYTTGINIINSRYKSNSKNNDFQFVLQNFINYHMFINGGMLLGRITIDSKIFYEYGEPESYRMEELMFYEIQADESRVDTEVIIIDQYDSRLNAILGLLRTSFVIMILASGVIYFCKDANDYVVVPIESMLMKVRRIANNPLEAVKIQQDEEILEGEYLIFCMPRISKSQDVNKVKEHQERSQFETAILEKLIVKTGMLLALGFGEAGANIIAENMRKGDAVNPLVSGTRMFGIFGFCDIRNFTDMTEVLQEKVMLFVNDIASIVHSNGMNYATIQSSFLSWICQQVLLISKSDSRNIGDAFLLVWKISNEICKISTSDEPIIINSDALSGYADFALLSFIRIVIKIKQSHQLDELSHSENVIERLPGYQVKLGYGLHFGWAIEGAIGSNFKIDASYLSPNVNMAGRLETATKQYGTGILISQTMQKILGLRVKSFLRKIDKVIMSGDTIPTGTNKKYRQELYTFDLDVQQMDVVIASKTQNMKILRYKQRKTIEKQVKKLMAGRMQVFQYYENDELIQSSRDIYTKEFYDTFQQGLDYYLLGHWNLARQFLNISLNIDMDKKDGPSQALLEFMETYQFQAPSSWMGYRRFVEK